MWSQLASLASQVSETVAPVASEFREALREDAEDKPNQTEIARGVTRGGWLNSVSGGLKELREALEESDDELDATRGPEPSAKDENSLEDVADPTPAETGVDGNHIVEIEQEGEANGSEVRHSRLPPATSIWGVVTSVKGALQEFQEALAEDSENDSSKAEIIPHDQILERPESTASADNIVLVSDAVQENNNENLNSVDGAFDRVILDTRGPNFQEGDSSGGLVPDASTGSWTIDISLDADVSDVLVTEQPSTNVTEQPVAIVTEQMSTLETKFRELKPKSLEHADSVEIMKKMKDVSEQGTETADARILVDGTERTEPEVKISSEMETIEIDVGATSELNMGQGDMVASLDESIKGEATRCQSPITDSGISVKGASNVRNVIAPESSFSEVRQGRSPPNKKGKGTGRRGGRRRKEDLTKSNSEASSSLLSGATHDHASDVAPQPPKPNIVSQIELGTESPEGLCHRYLPTPVSNDVLSEQGEAHSVQTSIIESPQNSTSFNVSFGERAEPSFSSGQRASQRTNDSTVHSGEAHPDVMMALAKDSVVALEAPDLLEQRIMIERTEWERERALDIQGAIRAARDEWESQANEVIEKVSRETAAEVAQLQKENSMLQVQLASLASEKEATVQILQTNLENTMTALKASEENRNQMQASLDSLRLKMTQSGSQADIVQSGFIKEVAELRKANEVAKSELMTLRDALAKQKETNRAVVEHAMDAEQLLRDELDGVTKSLQEKEHAFSEVEAAMTRRIAALERENIAGRTIAEELAVAQNDLQAALDQISMLKIDVENAQSQPELAKALQEIEALRLEVSRAESIGSQRLQALESELAATRADVTSLQSNLEIARQESEKMKRALMRTTEDLEKAEAVHRQKIATLRAEASRAKDDHDAEVAHHLERQDELRQEIIKLRDDLGASQRAIVSANQSFDRTVGEEVMDPRIISNLVLAFVKRSKEQGEQGRKEMVEMMARMLNWSEAEKTEAMSAAPLLPSTSSAATVSSSVARGFDILLSTATARSSDSAQATSIKKKSVLTTDAASKLLEKESFEQIFFKEFLERDSNVKTLTPKVVDAHPATPLSSKSAMSSNPSPKASSVSNPSESENTVV